MEEVSYGGDGWFKEKPVPRHAPTHCEGPQGGSGGVVEVRKGMAEMNKWNWVEIDNLVKDMTRIYRRNGHEVMRDEFKQVLTPKGPRYTAKCRACERRLNFVIAMGLVEPKGVKATAIDYCPEGK